MAVVFLATRTLLLAILLIVPPAMFRVSVMMGACIFTFSAHARHPNPPEGGLVIDPSGNRGIVGSSKSNPLVLVTRTVE
eukprot:7114504-Pyramimonas_sp.AAC.1